MTRTDFDISSLFEVASQPEMLWQEGVELLSARGVDAVCVASALKAMPTAVGATTNLRTVVMDDYVGSNIVLKVPFMERCAQSLDVDEILVEQVLRTPNQIEFPLAELFEAHQIKYANLFPNASGSVVSGTVLYAETTEGQTFLADRRHWPKLRLATTLLASICGPYAVPEDLAQRYSTVPRLSQREREALHWLAAGHRTDRIAERMNVTPFAVNKLFASARQRLGARTREQTLAVAIVTGQLSI